ncbi:transposase Mu, partial [Candidatus Omnitrophus magneticus]
PSIQSAEHALINLENKWSDKYPLAVKPWKNNWIHISTFFKYPDEIRKLIYTTNSVEALHRQFRKLTKNRSLFPTDDALLKILYLASQEITKKWTNPIHNWALVIYQLTIMFEGMFNL